MKILGISTTTHSPTKEHPTPATSLTTLKSLLSILEEYGHEIKLIDANDLHIVKNLSCYSTDKKNCASKDAGEYRCWATFLSHENPIEYGGKDEMPVIYDGLDWCDIVIFSTSVRWMSHSALFQRIIERLNTLENRVSVYDEPNPLANKKAGFIVIGQHYQSQQVASHLVEVLNQIGFITDSASGVFTWQRTLNRNLEQDGSNTPHIISYLASEEGSSQLNDFITWIEN